jgi:hypothetical protein
LDIFLDLGGSSDSLNGSPDIPASNDVYKGFATNTGTDFIQDFGGNGDVLDLRPYSTGDVFVTAIDFDGMLSSTESLQIVTGLTGQIIIVGQFGDVSNITTDFNYHGHIETIRFADKTFSSASALQSITVASTEALSSKQARLGEAAEGLAKEARALLAEMPEPGTRRGSGEGGDEGGLKPAGEPAKTHKADTKQTTVTKAPPEKKQATKTKSRHEKKRATKAPRENKPATRATHEKKQAASATHEKKQATKAAKPRAQQR